MIPYVRPGPRDFELTVDEDSHREYKLVSLVVCNALDGPFTALLTPGLAVRGSVWEVGNDLDSWAYCLPDAEVKPLVSRDANTHFEVTQKFSTKPTNRCVDLHYEDPLLEPPKISGSFTKYTEEAQYDRFGKLITNSAHEPIKGPLNEWDMCRPTIRIEQNVPTLFQAAVLPAQMANMVNSTPMWGLPPRTIKLSPVSWEKKYFGTCYTYYSRVLEFEIRYDTFDRDILDQGTKVLKGRWNNTTGLWTLINIGGQPPDPLNPSHFIRYQDAGPGNTTNVNLDGHGQPVVTTVPILTCGECPTGAPRFWRLSMNDPTYDGLLLEYVSDCIWEGTISQPVLPIPLGVPSGASILAATTVRLEYSLFDDAWILTSPALIPIWTSPRDPTLGSLWGCTSSNELYKGTAGVGPYMVTVTPANTSQGMIHVEKYTGGNLFDLGIPWTF